MVVEYNTTHGNSRSVLCSLSFSPSLSFTLSFFHSLLYSAMEDAIAEKIVSEALEYTKECIRRAVERDPRYNGVKRRQQEVKVCHDTLLSFRVWIHHAVCALV